MLLGRATAAISWAALLFPDTSDDEDHGETRWVDVESHTWSPGTSPAACQFRRIPGVLPLIIPAAGPDPRSTTESDAQCEMPGEKLHQR